jgi:hypothetical protein
MKPYLIFIILVLAAGTAYGMVGGPLFSVGSHMTAMTVEAAKVHMEVSSPGSSDGEEAAASNRLMLTARYGLTPGLDVSACLGTADLTFGELSSGYSDFTSNWSFAWGGAVRAGLPAQPSRFQLVAAVNYVGYQPHGQTTNGLKNIDSQYLWHEVVPTAAVGYRFGPVLPYIGASKPYLFGRRDVTVALRGQEFPTAGGTSTYTDSEQPLRGILGLEWRLPQGYAIGAEAAATTKGVWTLAVSIAQVLR